MFGSAHLHPPDSRAVISSGRRRLPAEVPAVIALAAPTVVGRTPHRVWQRCMASTVSRSAVPVAGASSRSTHRPCHSPSARGLRSSASLLCRHSYGPDGLPDRLCFDGSDLVHRPLWKFMGGLSGSSGGAASADGFLEVTRFNKAYVSIGGHPP